MRSAVSNQLSRPALGNPRTTKILLFLDEKSCRMDEGKSLEVRYLYFRRDFELVIFQQTINCYLSVQLGRPGNGWGIVLVIVPFKLGGQLRIRIEICHDWRTSKLCDWTLSAPSMAWPRYWLTPVPSLRMKSVWEENTFFSVWKQLRDGSLAGIN